MSTEAEDLLQQMQKDFDNALDGKFEEVTPDADDEKNSQEEVQEEAQNAGPEVGQSGEPGDGENPTPPPTDEELAAQAEASAKDDEIEELRSQMSEMQEKMEAQQQNSEEAEQPPAEQPQQFVDPAEALADDDKQLLAQYEEEWPEVAKAEALQRDVLAQRLGLVLQNVLGQFSDQMKTMQARIDELSTGMDNTKLSGKYGDVDTVLTEVKGWAEKQPGFMKKEYLRIIDKGSVKEKQELIDYYRDKVAKPTITQESGGNRQASGEADSLAPVQNKRSGVPASDSTDPTDEKQAWADALRGI